jgi:hypothetical protein
VLAIVLLYLVFSGLPHLAYLYTEWLWFKTDVGFPGVFWTILGSKVGLGAVAGLLFLVLILGNVEYARRLARRTSWYEEERALRQQIAEVMEYFVGRYLYLLLALVSVVAAYGVAAAAAEKWNLYLLFRQGQSFGASDPIFRQDLGFYVFRLPFLRYLWQWAYVALIAVFLVSAGTHYLAKAIRTLRGMPAFAPHVKAHLSVLLGLILVTKAIGYRLESFYLLYSARGAAYGASYTDVHAQLLAYNVLLVIALGCAALVLINIYFRGLWLPLAGIGFLAVSSLLLNISYPALVQRFQVQPNEFDREKPYIEYAIRHTRQGFNLDQIEGRELRELEPLTMDAVRRNLPTIDNVRLWDYRPLLDTYQQQQALWPYYRFQSVDIDRYLLSGRYRQVMLAARELWVQGLPIKGWQNEHLFNTHGYGLVMSPVTDVIQSGLPNLVIRDIPPESSAGLKITQPAIYYGEVSGARVSDEGELTDNYVLVQTTEQENDYPLPGTNQTAKTKYHGRGGVPIGGMLARSAVATRFRDINLLISKVVTPQTRLMWGRIVPRRASHIAPFLSYDQDPYIVLGDDGRLYWIQDAYTVSAMYPYSEPYVTETGGSFNYVRNSVKVVTDAYDGTVTFYVADPKDPIVRTYERIFPELFRPLTEMPAGLLAHIRYPEALLNAQSYRLTAYHMTDPRAFYNRIEKWEMARETPKSVGPGVGSYGGGEAESQGETMEAYYALMRLPGARNPEFILMLPFTPQNRPNMVAWMAARCDGTEYGKLLVYYFPKTEQIWGPIQIEASISQDTEISKDITLWNQQGSSVIRGNLLVIPLNGSLLYVEPIYLKASQSRIPELKQVVVARGDGRVEMRGTLSEALSALLGEPPPGLEAEAPALPRPGPQAPAPAAAPQPTAAGADVRALAQEADRLYREALDRQRKGDWAGYGETMKKLQKTLQDLVAKSGG